VPPVVGSGRRLLAGADLEILSASPIAVRSNKPLVLTPKKSREALRACRRADGAGGWRDDRRHYRTAPRALSPYAAQTGAQSPGLVL